MVAALHANPAASVVNVVAMDWESVVANRLDLVLARLAVQNFAAFAMVAAETPLLALAVYNLVALLVVGAIVVGTWLPGSGDVSLQVPESDDVSPPVPASGDVSPPVPENGDVSPLVPASDDVSPQVPASDATKL